MNRLVQEKAAKAEFGQSATQLEHIGWVTPSPHSDRLIFQQRDRPPVDPTCWVAVYVVAAPDTAVQTVIRLSAPSRD
jgi:hypothetical protein